MGSYGDPEALEALARALDRDAAEVRARARALVAAAAQTAWRGAAAEAFRRSVDRDAAALGQAADELEGAAAALRAHAAEVRARLARIRAVERAVQGWFDAQLARLRAVPDEAASGVRALLDDPPWTGWPWRPGRLPGPGDRAWLDVGDDLRARGVPT